MPSDPSRDPAVLPTADAPTAEELPTLTTEAIVKLLDRLGHHGITNLAEAEALFWLSSRLPSLLAADADRQRMDWLDKGENIDSLCTPKPESFWEPRTKETRGMRFLYVDADDPSQDTLYPDIRAAIDGASGINRASRSTEGAP